jgi:hypothetical protein
LLSNTVHAQGGSIEDASDYQAIIHAAPFLTQLRLGTSFLKLPAGRGAGWALVRHWLGAGWAPAAASATALPQQVAALLAASTKLEDLALHTDDASQLVDISALAAGTQLQRLEMTCFLAVSSLSPLGGMENMQSLNISGCDGVTLEPGEASEPQHEQLQPCV